MKRIVVTLYRKRESLKVKLSNNLLVAVLQAMLAVCRGIKMKKKSLKAVGTVLAVCLCVQQPVEVQLPQQQRITQ